MQHIYNSIEEYNPGRRQKVLIVFDDMITDKISKETSPKSH